MAKTKIGHHQQVLLLLQDHFKGREIVGIEIGTARGDLTHFLLSNLPNLTKLYTIDPWTHRDGVEFEASLPQKLHDESKLYAYNVLKKFGSRVKILDITSDEAVYRIPELVDFAWIDGDHEENQVKRDIDNYDDFVKNGGIIGGHDFGQVPKLTEQIRAKYGDQIKTGDDFCWWVFL